MMFNIFLYTLFDRCFVVRFDIVVYSLSSPQIHKEMPSFVLFDDQAFN